MEIILGIILMFLGTTFLAIGIGIMKTPRHIYLRNHEITKQINEGKRLDSDLVEKEIAYDLTNGQLSINQKLAVRAMNGPDYGN